MARDEAVLPSTVTSNCERNEANCRQAVHKTTATKGLSRCVRTMWQAGEARDMATIPAPINSSDHTSQSCSTWGAG
eukprot:3041509-Amphidinium_carterae.3